MKTILVDEDIVGLQGFEEECGEMPDIEVVGSFTSSVEALEYAKNNVVECALLDIEMPELDGFELYKKLKELYPKIVVVFVTAHAHYAEKAIRKKVDYMVFKPYDKADIDDVMARVRLLKNRLKKRVYCHTFGSFDVFVDGVPIVFKSAKAKEILALCMYRQGAPVTSSEIIDKLWEGYSGTVGKCSVFRYSVKQLVDTLKEYNISELFGRKKGICYVNKDLLNCDYYELLNNDPKANKKFQGEFLTEYSWAESAIYGLEEKKYKV